MCIHHSTSAKSLSTSFLVGCLDIKKPEGMHCKGVEGCQEGQSRKTLGPSASVVMKGYKAYIQGMEKWVHSNEKVAEPCSARPAALPEVVLLDPEGSRILGNLRTSVKAKQLLPAPLSSLAFVCVDLVHSEQEQGTGCPLGALPASWE